MAGKAGLKAGLIGVVVMLVVTVINQFVLQPSGALVYVACGVGALIYAAIGVLAGSFLTPPRTASKGAGSGAIAGLVSSLVSGVVGFVITSVRLAQGLGYPGLDPQQMEQLTDMGMDLQMLAVPGVVCGLAIGAGVAAIGGAILAAVKPD